MQENLLKESLDSEPYEFTYFKTDSFYSGYEFSDERGHEYKIDIHRRPTYGKYVCLMFIGEKTPSRRSYKKIVGQFKDPMKALATFAAIFKDIKENHHDYVKGIVLNIPEKAFAGYSDKVRSVLQRALKNEYSFPIMTVNKKDDEILTVGKFHVAMVMRPFKYENVFAIGDNLKINPKDSTTPEERADDKLVQSFSDFLRNKNSKDIETVVDDKHAEEKEEKKDTVKSTGKSDIKPLKKITPKNDIKDSTHVAEDADIRTDNSIDRSLLTPVNEVFKKIEESDVDANIYMNYITIRNSSYDNMFTIRQISKNDFVFYLNSPSTRVFIKTDTYKLLNEFVKFDNHSGSVYKSKRFTLENLLKLIENSKFISALKKYNEMTVEVNDDHSVVKAISYYRDNKYAHLVKNNELNVTFNTPIGSKMKLNLVDSGNGYIITLEGGEYFKSVKDRFRYTPTFEGNKIIFKDLNKSGINDITKSIFNFYDAIGSTKKYNDHHGTEYIVADSHEYKIVTIKATPYLVEYFKQYRYDQYLSLDSKYLAFRINDEDYTSLINTLTSAISNSVTISNIIEQVNEKHEIKTPITLEEQEERAKKYIDSVNIEDKSISKKEYKEALDRSIVNSLVDSFLGTSYDGTKNRFNLENYEEKDFKELTENSGHDAKILNGLYEVEGLKTSVKDNSEAEYKKIFPTSHFKVLEIFNKYGISTKDYYDILGDSAEFFAKGAFISTNSFQEALKRAKTFKHKKLTNNYIFTSLNKINKEDTTYFGEQIKGNKTYNTRLSELSYKHISGLEDLKDTVIRHLKKNDHSSVETFTHSEDGTRNAYGNEIKSLIGNFIDNISLDEVTANKDDIYEFIHSLQPKFQPSLMSNVAEIFANTFWHTWAFSGGTNSHMLAYATLGKFGANNIGKEYYSEQKIYDKPDLAFKAMNPNLYTNFHYMYEETQKFYKAKFKAKYAGKKVKLYRGVSGKDIDRYTPGTIESWTTVVSTAKAFAKMMSGHDRNGYILEVELPYSALISSWEVLGQTGDFPIEANLKGKKEHMVLGGCLKDAEVKAYNISNPSQIKSIQIFEGFLAEKTDDKEDSLPPTILKVVYANDKAFTDPTTDKSIVSGTELEEHSKRKQKTKK